MTDITIPPATLEAVFKLLYPYMDTGGSETMAREVCEDACIVMLRSWPGMKLEHLSNWVMSGPDLPYVEEVASIILPLTENIND